MTAAITAISAAESASRSVRYLVDNPNSPKTRILLPEPHDRQCATSTTALFESQGVGCGAFGGKAGCDRARSPAELAVVESPDPAQPLELVAQVRSHHLRPVGRDRERHAVVHERAEGVAHDVLFRERLR
jgi:hypothetical protein